MLWAYNALLPLARVTARVAAPLFPKVQVGLAGRRGALQRLEALGGVFGGRILWIHTSSVGEYEQARPIAALLRERYPQLELLHTFFSPSGYDYARRLAEAPHIEYLPEDTPAAARRALAALRPAALVFVKFDLWPNLAFEARRRGVPSLLLDATLRPRSWRSRFPAIRLYRDLYHRIDVISAVAEADARRFRAVAPLHAGIHHDGDTRFDQVVRRRRAAKRVGVAPELRAAPRGFTLVAGSTWPADEARLVPAWRALRDAWRESAPPRLVLVPHEPTPAHVERLESELRRAGLASRRYSSLSQDGCESAPLAPDACVIVDRVGILAELYALGDVAYVGGAFTTGVHSLVEPAIFALPLLFGPRHHNAPEADMLLEARAGAVIRSAAELEAQLVALCREPEARRAMGDRAQKFVESKRGATERCVERIAALLEGAGAGRKESRA